MLLQIALFVLSLGSVLEISLYERKNFLYATVLFSALSLFLQTGANLLELCKCGRYFPFLILSKLLTCFVGPYAKYSAMDLKQVKESQIRGRVWNIFLHIAFCFATAFNFATFDDPYSDTFQVRYKSLAIWLSKTQVCG